MRKPKSLTEFSDRSFKIMAFDADDILSVETLLREPFLQLDVKRKARVWSGSLNHSRET